MYFLEPHIVRQFLRGGCHVGYTTLGNRNNPPQRKFEPLPDLLAGVSGEFKPRATYIQSLDWVEVKLKDCSFVSGRVSAWANIYWEHHRPWYAPWRKCVGFQIWNPIHRNWPYLAQYHNRLSVHFLLDRITAQDANAFGEYRAQIYRAGQGLEVDLTYHK